MDTTKRLVSTITLATFGLLTFAPMVPPLAAHSGGSQPLAAEAPVPTPNPPGVVHSSSLARTIAMIAPPGRELPATVQFSCPPCLIFGVPAGKFIAWVVSGIVATVIGGVIVIEITDDDGVDVNEAIEDFLEMCEDVGWVPGELTNEGDKTTVTCINPSSGTPATS